MTQQAEIRVSGRGDFRALEQSLNAARRKTEAEVSRIRKAFDQVSGPRGLQSFQGLANGLVGAVSISNAVGLADAYTNMNARLSLVTSSTEEFNRVQAQLTQIAQQTRAPLAETVDLYTRIARSTAELGIEQSTLAQVTENISKALVISGSDASSAQAAIVQLGQGFAAGALRGEELNSVMEQTPRLAEAIAKGLGVSIGQLREMGKEGKLTAEAVIGALVSQTQELDTEFKKMPRTAEQGLTAVKNSVLLLIGRLDSAWGFTKRLAEGFEILARAADKPGETFGRMLGIDDIGELDRNGRALRDALELTMRQMERFQTIASNASGSTKTAAEAQVERLRSQHAQLSAQLSENIQKLKNLASDSQKPTSIVSQLGLDDDRAAARLEKVRREWDALKKTTKDQDTAAEIARIRALGKEAGATQAEINAAVAAATPKGFGGGASVFKRIEEDIARAREELDKFTLGATEAAIRALARDGATPQQQARLEAILNQIEARKTLRQLEEDQRERDADRAKAAQDEAKARADSLQSIQEQIEQQRIEIATMGQSEAARRTALTMLEAERAGVAANTAEWFRLRDAVLSSNTAYAEATRLQQLLADTPSAKLAEQRRDMELLTEALQKFIDTGGKEGISQTQYLEAVTARLDLVKEKTDDANDAARSLGLTFQSAFEDAILEGAKFREVLDGIIKDIARLVLRKSLTEPFVNLLTSWFTAGGGGGANPNMAPASLPPKTAAAAPGGAIGASRTSVQVNNYFNGQQSTADVGLIQRRVQEAALSGVQQAMKRNGAGFR